jgi:hypothetical protein
MPSLGEITEVLEVSEVSDVSEVLRLFGVSGVLMDSGVDVIGACVDVLSETGIAVDGGDVTVLWQAARKKMSRDGMIFFIVILCSFGGLAPE